MELLGMVMSRCDLLAYISCESLPTIFNTFGNRVGLTCFACLCFSGEAAGLALGLVMLGSKNAQAIEDMVGYAQETQHEKILRGLAVGIALVMYGRMEEADALIESLCRDKVS